jgi:hypothetical protein
MTERFARSRYLNAADAAAFLGVSRSSLYAYVSRGRIHAESDPSIDGRRLFLEPVEHSSVPRSVAMWGCFSAASDFASRSNRAIRWRVYLYGTRQLQGCDTCGV